MNVHKVLLLHAWVKGPYVLSQYCSLFCFLFLAGKFPKFIEYSEEEIETQGTKCSVCEDLGFKMTVEISLPHGTENYI